MMEPRGILILGVGNLLRKDDGVGVQAVQRLKGLSLPGGVKVVDGGMAGVGLLDMLEGFERAVIIDSADLGLDPGSVVKFGPEAIRFRSPELRLSLHSADVAGVLELARLLGKRLPEMAVIVCNPATRAGAPRCPWRSLPRCGTLWTWSWRRSATAVPETIRSSLSWRGKRQYAPCLGRSRSVRRAGSPLPAGSPTPLRNIRFTRVVLCLSPLLPRAGRGRCPIGGADLPRCDTVAGPGPPAAGSERVDVAGRTCYNSACRARA